MKDMNMGLAGSSSTSDLMNGVNEHFSSYMGDTPVNEAYPNLMNPEELCKTAQMHDEPSIASKQVKNGFSNPKAGESFHQLDQQVEHNHENGCRKLVEELDFDTETSEGKRGSMGIPQPPLSQNDSNIQPDFIRTHSTIDISDLPTRGAAIDIDKPPDPDVIVIEDDDETDLESDEVFFSTYESDDDHGSDESSKESPIPYLRRVGKEGVLRANRKSAEIPKSFIEEDCCILEPGSSRRHPRLNRMGAKAYKRHEYNSSNYEYDPNSSNDSSDCEIVEDPHGTIRQNWEQAALQKQVRFATKAAVYSAESEGSTSASNIATSTSRKQTVPSAESNIPTQGKGTSAASDQQDSNYACSDVRLEGEAYNGEVCLPEKLSTSIDIHNPNYSINSQCGNIPFQNATAFGTSLKDPVFSKNLDDGSHVAALGSIGGLIKDQLLGSEGARTTTEAIPEDILIGDRERFKETAEYRSADEEEWTRRQLELQRQAEEARLLKKRKKAAAIRKLEMESRQRQRLEEIRQNQQAEEHNLDFKEQVRGRIQVELEQMAASCLDMATLLRRLGVQVDGGRYPTTEQVNAAYKRALLRFHPDRVAALTKDDPVRQVESEETFKLISKLKNTMQPVACRLFF